VVAEPKPQQFMVVMKIVIIAVGLLVIIAVGLLVIIAVGLLVIMVVNHTVQYNSSVSKG
jgi:hypothetical protein